MWRGLGDGVVLLCIKCIEDTERNYLTCTRFYERPYRFAHEKTLKSQHRSVKRRIYLTSICLTCVILWVCFNINKIPLNPLQLIHCLLETFFSCNRIITTCLLKKLIQILWKFQKIEPLRVGHQPWDINQINSHHSYLKLSAPTFLNCIFLFEWFRKHWRPLRNLHRGLFGHGQQLIHTFCLRREFYPLFNKPSIKQDT